VEAAVKSLLITGGTGDLGNAVVPRLHQSYRCVVVYRRVEEWERLQKAAGGGGVVGVAADVTDETSVAGAISSAADQAGPFHGLVHLVGGFEAGKIEETSAERWNHLLKLNLTAAFLVARAVIPQLSRGGRIIMVSSASTRRITGGIGAYLVSKGALNVLVEVLAAELKGRITVNAILPTTLDTPANRKEADPAKLVPLEHVADTIAFLLSDAASHLTGSQLVLSR
jgi:NAD(P)-dependent dehydrogenase (short-subunit alcohol dehydrogenase family)